MVIMIIISIVINYLSWALRRCEEILHWPKKKLIKATVGPAERKYENTVVTLV